MDRQQIYFRDLGRMDYGEAWAFQERLLQENTRIKSAYYRADAAAPTVAAPTTHHLLFVEHPPVYTLGKSGNRDHVLIGEEEMRDRSIQFFQTNRGGDITFHGVGQIVGYPILDLEKFGTDIDRYLRNLEEVIIRVLAEYGLPAGRSAGETGVWLDPDVKGRERKICAIGVRCSRWVTMHGFAFNVNTDLSYFSHIIPCGIAGKQVTSLHRETGREMEMHDVKERVKRQFARVFEADLVSEVLF